MDRVLIKERARDILRNDRGTAIGVGVLYMVLGSVATTITAGLGSIFLMPPLVIGMYLFHILMFRGKRPSFDALFEGFSHYTQSLVGMLWMWLFTCLWSLLFIIPGIIKAYAYWATPYLLADYPDLNPREALKLSMRITQGRKMEIFVMQLSFFGWALLSGFTFGILYIIHVGPYMNLSLAGLYDAMLHDALEDGTIDEHELHG